MLRLTDANHRKPGHAELGVAYLTSVRHYVIPAIWGIVTSFALPAGFSYASHEPRLILIHVDAVAFDLMQEEIDKGNLPNIDYYFNRKGLIKKALTYFPSQTPFVISSIREAKSISEGRVVGWRIPEYDDDVSLQMPDTFILMAKSKMRLARANLIYGLPAFDWLAELALMNTVQYFDDYHILEYYWYKIDTYGHFEGKDSYLSQLHDFDRIIGRYVKKLCLDINVVIYSDHGMVFGEGVPIDDIVMALYGDDIDVFSYPILYLNDHSEKDRIARHIVENTPLDFSFYQVEDGYTVGFSGNTEIHVHKKNDEYSVTFEGEDVFNYDSLGYNGEYKPAYDWLKFTMDHDYPATPVVISKLLNNPNAGEIVVSFDDTKFAQNAFARRGNHGGFTAREMIVPVFFRGPDVKNLHNYQVLYLEDLFGKILNFNFHRKPNRDRHNVTVDCRGAFKKSAIGISVSPAYRYKFGLNLSNSCKNLSIHTGHIWGIYDLQRSFLSRLWIGAGFRFSGKDIAPLMKLRYSIGYGKLNSIIDLRTSGGHRILFGRRLTDHLHAYIDNFKGVGFRYTF